MMNASRLSWVLLLCLAGLISPPAWAISQLYVFIGTGNDDLRAGSSLKMIVEFHDGRSERFDLSRGRRFADNTNTSVVLPVAPPNNSGIARISLEWSPDRRDFMSDDEWQMNQISIHDGAGPGDPVIFDLQANRVQNPGQMMRQGGGPFTRQTGPQRFSGELELVLYTRPSTAEMQCRSDLQCNDGVFCNGAEICQPGSPNADPGGCVAGTAPCAGSSCNEQAQSCATACVDADGDGVPSAHCGGTDCNDNDPRVFPGSVEVWDAANRDEDCDPDTTGFSVGMADQVQFCDGENVLIMASGSRFVAADCPAGTKCIPQPNGTGVCGTPPPGYLAPQRFTPPGRQQVNSTPRLVPRATDLLRPAIGNPGPAAPQ